MFTLDPGDELALVVETARKLAAESLAPGLREAERNRAVPDALRATWAEVGLTALELPEALGGAGLGCLARVHVNEALAAGDVGALVALDAYGPAATALLEIGGNEAVARLVDRVGEAGRALLVTDRDATITVDGGHVSTDVAWMPAEAARAIVLLVGDEVLFVEDRFAFEPTRGAGLRAAGAARLMLDDAPIAARWRDAGGARRALARARLDVASKLLGVMSATCTFSADYAQQREAFGRPIAHHQALAYLIVDMRMALDAARLVVHEAAWRVDAGRPAHAEAASALAECIEASRTIGPAGVQILGGHGFMADYPVEKHMREGRALGQLLGGFDAAVEDAGREFVDADAPLSLVDAEGAG